LQRCVSLLWLVAARLIRLCTFACTLCLHTEKANILPGAPVQASSQDAVAQDVAQSSAGAQPDSVMAEASVDAPATAADSGAPLETAATESAPEASQVSLYALLVCCLSQVLINESAAGGCYQCPTCFSRRQQRTGKWRCSSICKWSCKVCTLMHCFSAQTFWYAIISLV